MRQETNHRSLLELVLQLGDEAERFRAHMVEIENNERRFLFAIELDAFSQVLFGLNKFDLDVQLARGLLNLGLEKQVVHKAKDTRRGILAHGQRLGFKLRIVRRKARPM